MTIEEILAGESKNVEFKENLPEKSIKYMKSVVAFANGNGGKIIFGIADKTREVIGFGKEEVFKIMDAIANAVSDTSTLQSSALQIRMMTSIETVSFLESFARVFALMPTSFANSVFFISLSISILNNLL